jgi:hypothetical protein
MGDQWWSWALTLIGVTGFWLAGRKVWWCWYVNIGNQALWLAYAITTQQWGFLLSVPVYLAVFVPNAYRWTRERFPKFEPDPCAFCLEPIRRGAPYWIDSTLTDGGRYCTQTCMTDAANQRIPEWRP